MLTPEEQAELDALNKELGPAKTGGLTPDEQAELDALNKELGPPQAKPQEEKGFLQTAGEQLPAGASAMELSQGKNPYSMAPEGLAKAAGDIGGLAGVGAALAAGVGMAPLAAGLGGAALLGAGMEKAGISPAMREMGSRIMQADKVAPFAESSNPLVKGAQYAGSLAGQVPAAVKSASWEALPSILSQLGMMVPGMMKPGAPKPIEPGAAALEAAGAETTPAMRSGGKLAAAQEISARSNPLTMGKMEAVDAGVHDAVRSIAQKSFGQDVLESNPVKQGEALKGALDTMADKRAEAYAPAVAALSGKFAKSLGQSLLDTVKSFAKDESMNQNHVNALYKVLKDQISTKSTILGMDKALSAVKDEFKKQVAPGEPGLKGQAAYDFGKMLDAVKNRFYDGMGDVGPKIRAAKGEYAAATKGMEPLSDVLKDRLAESPEKIGIGILSKGSGAVKSLLQAADPATASTIRKSLAHAIVREAVSGENLSGATLKTLIGKRFKDIVPLLGEEGVKLKSLSDAMEAGNVATLSKQNPSGSGLTGKLAGGGLMTGLGAGAIGLGHPALALGGILGKTGMDLAYAHGGVPIQNALRTAQTAMSKAPVPVTPQQIMLQKAQALTQSLRNR